MPRNAIASAATLLPLAIGLANYAVSPTTAGGGAPGGPTATVEAVTCGEGIEDFRSCHSEYPTGCSSTGKYDPYLNFMKNQLSWTSTQPEGFFTTLQDYQQLEAKLPDSLGK